MRQAGRRTRTGLGSAMLVVVSVGLIGCEDDDRPEPTEEQLALGVTYKSIERTDGGETVELHLVTVRLDSDIGIGVLTPGSVTDAMRPSVMAERAGDAVAVVNGDYFNNGEDHTSCYGDDSCYTNAAVGPVLDAGRIIKSAVVEGQIMGPSRRPGDTSRGDDGAAESVFGITTHGQPAISRLRLTATQWGPDALKVSSLNSYAIPENGIGVYTEDWGDAPRKRAVCGSDQKRESGCASMVREIRLDQDGTVTSISDEAGSGPIHRHEQVLLGRGDGARTLSRLSVGDYVGQFDLDLLVDSEQKAERGIRFVSALGGMSIVENDTPVKPLPEGESESRTAVGYSENGEELYLVTVEGETTLDKLANLMIDVGSHEAISFDGGGSSMLGTGDGHSDIHLRNVPDDFFGGERKVANALAVFTIDKRISRLAGAWSLTATDPGPDIYIDVTGQIEVFHSPSGKTFTGKLETVHPVEWKYTAEMRPRTGPPVVMRFTADPSAQRLTLRYAGQKLVYAR
jgi:hypothetical protein